MGTHKHAPPARHLLQYLNQPFNIGHIKTLNSLINQKVAIPRNDRAGQRHQSLLAIRKRFRCLPPKGLQLRKPGNHIVNIPLDIPTADPFRAAKYIRFSMTVFFIYRFLSPARRRATSLVPSPSENKTRPSVGSIKPAIIDIRVVFPLPFGATRAETPQELRTKLALSITRSVLNVLTTFSTSITTLISLR